MVDGQIGVVGVLKFVVILTVSLVMTGGWVGFTVTMKTVVSQAPKAVQIFTQNWSLPKKLLAGVYVTQAGLPCAPVTVPLSGISQKEKLVAVPGSVTG